MLFLPTFLACGPSRSHFIRSFALAIAALPPSNLYYLLFFCNSCFSQYNTLCVEERLVDKILSVSRETQYFSVFFCAPSVSFFVKFGLKNRFLLFGSMRGACLYFVAQCAFVPTRVVQAERFSACLLISMVCCAVFARLDWLDHRLGLPAGVLLFLGSAFQPFESVSAV